MNKASKPLITIGILGGIMHTNLEYNVNTYIGQSFGDFELLFCFDKKQCVPVSGIIDSLNAQNFEIDGRVRITEDKNNKGIAGNAKRIIEEAKGDYILFVSLEDAFYDNEALTRISNVIAQKPSQIHTFRTLINCNGQWIIFPTVENRQSTASVCYPKRLLEGWDMTKMQDCSNFAQFQQSLLTQILSADDVVNYADENTIVHVTTQEKDDLYGYYTSVDIWQEKVNTLLEQPNTQLDWEKLNQRHIESALRILSNPKLTADRVMDEFYCTYRLAKESVWPISDSAWQYLKILKFIYSCRKQSKAAIFSQLRLKYKLSSLKKHKKKKLLFLTHEYSLWPSFKSVYEEAIQNKRFETHLVYVPFFHEYSNINHEKEILNYKDAGYDIVSYQEYNLSEECPDVVFYVKPYDSIPEKYQVKEIRKIIYTIIYIPYGMEIGDTKECLRYQCYGNMQYYATHILAYSPLYLQKMQHYTYTNGCNYLTIGHPRIDLRQDKLTEENEYACLIMQKAGGRKIILWNTHFTISEGDNWGSFLQYGEAILDYFKNHSELFLLWRPHPLFYKALAESRSEELSRTKQWLQEISEHENILRDESSSYLTAIQVSDALISDWSSFVPEYMAYGKPVCVTPKNEDSKSILSNAEDSYWMIHNTNDIYEFLKNVQNSETDAREKIDYSEILFFPHKKSVAKELIDIIEQE
ncbi:MAG: CDP-glycerol glycerophosphotransferase family protein [Lachnospiraceae bacterium]|nr:CDP-glycerol glycerophosphotransferase family protein [Lachnospiraceae bacterium]MCM1233798.1 CDP-glycerol glycerophosphotransferase family protein [Ruminococcus flavefaciens]